MSQVTTLHKTYLLLAHSLAIKKFGKTFPNPSVGCVLVKNNKIIAKGSTGKNGRPHAEELVLKKAGKKSVGSTMYVTLEPCYHRSDQGSCAEQIINAQIKTIFIAKVDPDPRTNTKSIKLFKKNSIKTYVSFTADLTDKLNNFFFKSTKFKRPYIKVKMAISKDIKIAKPNYSSKWISNSKSREFAHFLRSQSQAILTTAKTILMDNPRLTIRQKNKKLKYIPIIIIDKNLKIPTDSKIVKSAKLRQVFIFSTKKNRKYKKLKELGCNILFQKLDKNKEFDLKMIMKKIYLLNINNIFVEAGGIFFTNLIKSKLVDELHLFTTPFVIGNKGKSMIYTLKISDLKLVERMRKYFGKDIYQYFYVNN